MGGNARQSYGLTQLALKLSLSATRRPVLYSSAFLREK